MLRNFSRLLAFTLLVYANSSFASDITKAVTAQLDVPTWISLYQPTYLLPFYYTEKTDSTVYQNATPDQQKLNKLEVNFQVSFKVPVWHNFISPNSTLYAAYTQLSYWQAYNNSPFFRETNYQPELYVENKLNLPITNGWQLKFVNVGVVHQSNGRGGALERSWNRLYADAILANQNWLVNVKPWYDIHDASMGQHNRDISKYLGYGRELIAYKYNRQVFSLNMRNVFESNFKRGAVQANWSFPLSSHFKGYIQYFSGYGQSLIEYNHYTNSAGIGIALNDWI